VEIAGSEGGRADGIRNSEALYSNAAPTDFIICVEFRNLPYIEQVATKILVIMGVVASKRPQRAALTVARQPAILNKLVGHSLLSAMAS
jgi:hypothetical protein